MSEHLCIACPHLRPSEDPNVYESPQVCRHCRNRLRADLGRIPDLYAQLTPSLEPVRRHGPRVSGTPTRSLGVHLEPLNLLSKVQFAAGFAHAPYLDHMADQHGPVAPLILLDQWCLDWRDYLYPGHHLPAPKITTLTSWLLLRVDDACDFHPAVDDFAAELRAIVRVLSNATRTDHHQGETVGRCPRSLRDDTRCNTQLRVDPYADVIRCARCDSTWMRRNGGWLKLRGEQMRLEEVA